MQLEPGRGSTLPSDEIDASLVLKVAESLITLRELVGNSIADRTLKEVIWSKWELPRLPRPLIDGKYPTAYPWSAPARELFLRSPKKVGRVGGLVIEHALPKRELLQLVSERMSTATAADMVQLLQAGCRAVVVTKEEDLQLTRAGFGHLRTNTEDLWSRYRETGLDPSTFALLRDAP
ncbi:hypothetical protein [Leucobacter sp. USHLN154]|uniref:hypothetical protein n=1 Tax=Leucobacter sp. USHLN154 TaxID=3081269 RepID=UPI003019B467